MKIAGPAIGGSIIGLFGAKSPFLFEAAGFFIATLFLVTLANVDETETKTPVRSEHNGYWKELAEGIKHIAKTPLLKSSVILSSAAFFIIFLYDGLFVFIVQKLGFSEGDFGLLISAVGLGSVAGSLFMGNWTRWKRKPIHVMSSAFLFSGSFIILMGLGSMGIIGFPPLAWGFAAFLLGFMASGESAPYGYILQSETPKQMMGRVSAAAASLQTFSMLMAPAAGSLLAKWLGVSHVLVGAGGATCFMAAFALLVVARKVNIQKDSQKKYLQS
jgi:MFS family permease